ncbi:TRAP-type C4-dicarboxylate transport system, periplasmic component (plasmid) [Sodalis praecaptivus]|uniref:TRAP-type C4-dicarboxylate transport system, periplasmic component n=1 Tax=Sodalis praecaptivus TaxID=1239307 RepID=W0I451_9GAMM|nr:TRAP-type C4-dicarboxylate transport system, periplasmic component [Sodalis praecaptivus]
MAASLRSSLRHGALALALCSAGFMAHAAETLRLAHASSSDSLINQAMVRFAAEVKKQSHDQLEIQLFPDGQLGDEGAIADATGSGAITMGLGGVVDAIDPRLNAVSLPFLFKDADAVHHFLDSAEGKKFLAMGEARGYVMLSALDSGFRQFATQRAITTPADLAGLKLRTPPNPVILATIKQLGGLPQSIPFGEVYTSLQSGVVDGVEPELRDFNDQRWYEVVKHVSMANYIWSANFWFMNKAAFDGLSAENKQVLESAVADITLWYRAQLDQVYANVTQQLKAKNVVFSDVDRAQFLSKVSPVYDQFSKEWGADFVKQLRHDAASE